MKSIHRIFTVAGKEWLQIMRDTRSLILSLIAPAFLILLFGYALTLDVKHIKFVVLDNDRSSHSREFIQQFLHTDYFSFMGLVDNYKNIDELLNQNKISIAIIIPPKFERDVDIGKQTSIQLIIDGSDSTSANVALGYFTILTTNYSMSITEKRFHKKGINSLLPGISIEQRLWYNETLETKNYILPGLIALILAIICALIASLTISREYERGTLETLLSTPLRAYEIVMGKIIPYLLIGLFDTISALMLGFFLFNLPFKGNFFEFLSISVLFLFGMCGMGILISTSTRMQVLSIQFAMVITYLPTLILSGFIFPISNMPTIIQIITSLIPAKYFITITKGIALKGAGTTLLKYEILFLLIFCIFITFLTINKFSQFIPYRRKINA